MKKHILIIMMICINLVWAIDNSEMNINLSANLSFNQALLAIENLSLSREDIKLYNLTDYNGKIGIPINDLTWRQAIKLIALYNKFVLEEKAGTIIIKKIVETKEIAEKILQKQKMIQISATAFIADKAFLKSLGIDWSTILNGEVNAVIGFNGGSKVPSDLFQLSGEIIMETPTGMINIKSMLNTIESNQLGKVIANPTILVADGKKGFIQVGQDFSSKTKDESGNTTETFYSTGIILDVIAKIIKENEEEVIQLSASVERSSVVPGDLSTVVNKSMSKTELIMYDGEETVIGGLYDSQETVTRSGLPILKDLPWWIFGIRYLTGYDKKEIIERELVIILKTEIIGSALERKRKDSDVSEKKEKKG
ncbi:MAG: hypothetical protein K8S23_04820 [Candidatus Cloacimonetes bacterium]|nr:hypothetical protein [Candidatus Cloacimonadota bacterium]